ncbi:porin [Vibrio sp. SCSIO 43136]|uniref:porin n=1 Tax=Vibrio sp. SCSIO 43136 TaxID=2819101 RepID=UPI002076509A|nr:porin [Vibrio sp. SCSIO 43136]USD67711.1 porin [Vibrio sp. SCSIO 43136]
MNKFFTRTLIASAISSITLAGAAFADTNLNPKKDEQGFYGLVALQLANRDYEVPTGAEGNPNSGVQANNETRLGWRGTAHFDSWENTTFIWQVESGYVDESFGGEDGGNGYLGRRDTYIGFQNDAYGLIRVGRVLTPIYELIDWPATNPGMGNVWDWGGAIGGNNFNDRQSDTIRWDTNELWEGFSLDLAVGAGADRAGATDSQRANKNYWHGGAAHQKFTVGDNGWVQFDLAYEMNYNTQDKSGNNPDTGSKDPAFYWDNQTYLIGTQGGFDNGIGYFAYYRVADAQNTLGDDEREKSYSIGLMYNFGEDNKWQAKVAHAENKGLEVNGKRIADTEDDVTSMQLMYSVDSNAVVYARYAMNNLGEAHTTRPDYVGRWKSDSFDEASIGIEYWF